MGGSLQEDEFNELKSYNLKCFVETGTYKADTTILARDFYEHVYTIELNKILTFDSILKAFSLGKRDINFYNDESLIALPKICEKINGNSCVFFLDAHASGTDSSSGDIRVPLLEEIECILSNINNSLPYIFILDDVRLWTTDVKFDWNHISFDKVLNIFKQFNFNITKSYEKNDRFYVFVNIKT